MSTRSADANSDYTPGLDRLTRYALIALAVAQALALYGLAQASDAFDAPRWLYGAYVVVGLLPLLFYLGGERLYDIHNLIAAVLLAPWCDLSLTAASYDAHAAKSSLSR